MRRLMRFVFGIETTGIETTRERKGATMKARNSGFMIGIGAAVAFLLAAAMPARADITNGVSGLWEFEEGSGTTAFDWSGYGNNGAISGATYTNDAKLGSYALSFDGNDDRVALGSGLLGSAGSNKTFTIAMWFRWKTLTAYDYMFGDDGQTIVIALKSNTELFIIHSAGVGSYPVPYATSVDTWYHFVLTASPSSWKIYINGSLVDTQNINPTIGAGGFYAGWAVGGENRYLDGMLDDVRVYNNRALSADDVTELYTNTVVPTPPTSAGGLRANPIVLEATNTIGSLQWQKSADSVTWSDIASATSNSLDVTTLYTNTPWFHVVATMVGSPPVTSQWMKVTSQAIANGTIFTIR